MSKNFKKINHRYDDEEDYNSDVNDKSKKRQKKQLNRIIHSKDIDYLMNEDYEEDDA